MLASAAVIEGGQVVARVLGGMDWCVGQGVRVLSMSLGLRGSVNDFLPLTQILRARSVLPVFAVGNEGPGTSRSPGNYAESLSVGASDRGNNIADFSSSQRFRRARDPIVPDIVAPGLDVLSAKPGGGYQSMSGSSMATPHIAGLAALLFEANPAATVDQVEAAILDASHLEPGWSPERAGRGVPDARRALKILTA
jgi:subtilisin family serine protease